MLYQGQRATQSQSNPRRPVMATQQTSRVLNPVTENPICIHALTGRAPKPKMCVHNFECATCPFDQMLEDMAPVVSVQKQAPITTAMAA
jgi:hypothetical protein